MAKILLLEDDPARINWFKKNFAQIDHTANVNEALKNIKANTYDAIFLDRDISDPNSNGEDLAWQMSLEKLAQNTPIVIHSESDRGQRVITRYLKTYHKNVSNIKFRDLKKLSSEKINEIVKTSSEKIEIKESKQDDKKSQSIFDFLFSRPGITINFNNAEQEKIKAAKSLFDIWKDNNNKISNTTYRKPMDMSSGELDKMAKEGLVRCIGDRVEITHKGSEVIKTLILGDDRSSFDKGHEEPLDIVTAEANIKKGKTLRKVQKQHEDQWWNIAEKTAQNQSFEREKYDFEAGKERAKRMTPAELHYAIKDLREVIEVQEESNRKGGYVPKLGYYHDELHTFVEELKRRQNG